MNVEHNEALIRLYQVAPINQFYKPTMTLEEGHARIEIQATASMHHTGGFVHGSVYFKMLDDAAYFAAHTLEQDFFLVTADFRIDLIRPFAQGKIHACGVVQHQGKKDILATATLHAENGKLLATGTGRFSRSTWPLAEQSGYKILQ